MTGAVNTPVLLLRRPRLIYVRISHTLSDRDITGRGSRIAKRVGILPGCRNYP